MSITNDYQPDMREPFLLGTIVEQPTVIERLPRGRWFAAGAVGVSGSTMARLVRLSLARRRHAPVGLSRTWDYFIPNR